jgi:hypothetical protein
MSESNNTDQLRNWLIILAVIFGLSFLGIAWIFSFSDFKFLNIDGLETSSRIKYGIKALTTIGATFGGIALLINSYYASRTANAANETARAANENAKAALKNAKIAEDKQITERFAKAVEMLGSCKIEVRLGGIYTLERIAQESREERWTIMEVLTAFVRENAPVKKYKEAEEGNIPELRTDIQAALTVIKRRNCENEEVDQRISFRNIDIRGANLSNAKLQYVWFSSSNLQNVSFYQAKLQGLVLCETNLQEADFSRSDLQRAYFSKTDLRGANFRETRLQGANLHKAINLTYQQIELAFGDENTKLPDGMERPEHWLTSG